jgi:hypothetical protein
MIEQLIVLGKSIHADNVAKGFWPEDKSTRNHGEAVMLMITELSEAVEIHRKGNRTITSSDIATLTSASGPETFKQYYEALIKNTIEEEMADTVIRLLDYCYGFGIKLTTISNDKKSRDNFGLDVLRLCWFVIVAFHFEEKKEHDQTEWHWSWALSMIARFCEWYNIDLLQHVQFKLKYNRTRAYKHGKQY